MHLITNTTYNAASLLLLVGFITISCEVPKPDTLFKDLTSEETGITFVNRLAYAEEFNMIDYLYYYDGGGVAVGDINNDGLSDIYLVSNEGENALYLNQGDMHFIDIAKAAGVQSPGKWKTGVSMVDVNADGLLDIYLCRLGNYKGVTGKNELYINQGDLTFKEQAGNYNLDFSGFSTQAAFFDVDNDGDLDAYLLNHSVHSQGSIGEATLRLETDSLSGDRMYRNDGSYFVDVSIESGIYQSKLGYGLGIGLSDINGDGYTDIYIANDFTENDFLYLNNGDWTFRDIYAQAADYTSLSSMGCDLADFNNDGLVDIVTLDMLPPSDLLRKSSVGEDPLEIFSMKQNLGYMPQYKRNMLQLNRGHGTFSEIAMMAGIHATDWSWAPLFADFDNDGWKDLFISNGIKGRPNDLDYLRFINSSDIFNNPDIPDSVLFNHMPNGTVPNYLFKNNQDLTFDDVSTKWGVKPAVITQGVAYGDLDNDGDLDLVLNNLDTLSFIKENRINEDTTNHFLTLELIGTDKNTKAIGSKIEIYCGTDFQLVESYTTRGFKSSVDHKLHFGLGKHLQIDSLQITWPGGAIDKYYELEVDQSLKISKTDQSLKGNSINTTSSLYEPLTNKELGINYVHQENNFIEFNREPLLPHMHSREGPALAVADINNDGLDDFFVGGAKHQQGSLYIQTEEGFKTLESPDLKAHALAEDVEARLFDFDNDGDKDLLVLSGGNEFEGDSPNREPRLYINDGTGSLRHHKRAFEGIYQTGSCIAVHDYDGDGWLDLFLGSSVVPWNYGKSPQSFLLKNDGGQKFLDESDRLPDQGELGMINDAKWVDLDGSGNHSLVLAGEWIEVTIIRIDETGSDTQKIPGSAGWWKTIDHIDYDHDGDQDLLLGNMGLNSKLKATSENPLRLYLNDFDQNGKQDALLTYMIDGKEHVFSTRNSLNRQIPAFGNHFSNNNSYASASLEDLFGQTLETSIVLKVEELRSGVFINDQQNYQFVPFPNIMQISFIRDFLLEDITGDEHTDILVAGNLFSSSMQQGMYAAGRSTLLTGLPVAPEPISNRETGIFLPGDIRQMKLLDYMGNDLIMVGVNSDSLRWLKRKKY